MAVESGLDAKWDKAIDITMRRLFYGGLSGAAAGAVFSGSTTGRVAAMAFGAGCGVGSAYAECADDFRSLASAEPTKATKQ
eukprot:PRCOL_00006286-RA